MADSYYTARQRQLKDRISKNGRKIDSLNRQERNLKSDIEKRRRMLEGAIKRQYEFDTKRRNAIAKGRTHRSYDERLRSQRAKAGKYVGQIRRDEEKLKRVQYQRAELESQTKTARKQLGYERHKVRFILAVEYKGEGTRHAEVEIVLNATADYLSTVSQLPFRIASVYLNKFYGQGITSVAKNKGQLGEHRYPPHEKYFAPDTSIRMEISYKDYDNRRNDREFPETDITSLQGALAQAERFAEEGR